MDGDDRSSTYLLVGVVGFALVVVLLLCIIGTVLIRFFV